MNNLLAITYDERRILGHIAIKRRYWHRLFHKHGQILVDLRERGLITKTGGYVTLSYKGKMALFTGVIICEERI